MPKTPLIFTVNDENIKNSHGFKVKTSGISLKRFHENPICLKDHDNTTSSVLGKWVGVSLINGLLQATPEFDTKDKDGLEVVRKVESNVIKSCSMGLSFNMEDLQMVDGELVLLKCELNEISIVAVPSNANCIALYTADGTKLTENEVQQLCLKLNTNHKQINMPTPQIIVTHLQLSAESTPEQVLLAIKATETKLTASKNENEQLKLKLKAVEDTANAKLKADFDTELDLALKDGRIDADGKASIVELSQTNPENATTFLRTLKKRKKVVDTIINGQLSVASFDNMSWEELDEGEHLVSLKANNPEYYKERFKQHFGSDPK